LLGGSPGIRRAVEHLVNHSLAAEIVDALSSLRLAVDDSTGIARTHVRVNKPMLHDPISPSVVSALGFGGLSRRQDQGDIVRRALFPAPLVVSALLTGQTVEVNVHGVEVYTTCRGISPAAFYL